MAQEKLYSVMTGEHRFFAKMSEPVVLYPSSCLKGKPRIEICVDNSPGALQKERALLARDFSSRSQVQIATSFLYKVLPNLMQGTLATSWESYGIVIGKQGDKISPLDLVEWIVKDPKSGPNESEEIRAPSKMPSDLAIVAKCLMVYRIAKVPDAESGYARKLTNELTALYFQHPFGLEHKPGGFSDVVYWAKNTTFCALVACVDMFLVKFPEHSLAKLRACTSESMYKDCVIISSINQIAEAMGMENAELITYVFHNGIADDVERVLKNSEKEELNRSDSYFPYMRELQVVPRSPYSASLNGDLYFWLHCIGCFLGQKRSFNARQIERTQPISIMTDAAYVVYYAAKNNAWQEQQQQESVRAEVTLETLKIKDEIVRAPPSEVLDKLKANRGRLTDEIKDYLMPAVRRINGERQGTIGRFIKLHFIGVERGASRN